MALMKCKSCGGVYEPEQLGGVRYFHVCPPLARVRVVRAGVEQDVPSGAVLPMDIVKVRRAGVEVGILVSAIQSGDQRLGDTLIERPNKRDENVVVTGFDAKGNPTVGIKSAGAGVDMV